VRIADIYRIKELKEWWKELRGGDKRKRPSILERMITLFQKEKIPYRLIHHPDVYSASELAASIHIPGREVAKAVIVRVDGRYAMAVLPAHLQLDLDRFGQLIGEGRYSLFSLAEERELEKLFPDCALGATPPLGNLYGLPVYVDVCLAQEPIIFFAAGSHHETIEMRFNDFERLVHPMVGYFALEPARALAA
jgi:Ala-tRNA(Pro) deacylase